MLAKLPRASFPSRAVDAAARDSVVSRRLQPIDTRRPAHMRLGALSAGLLAVSLIACGGGKGDKPAASEGGAKPILIGLSMDTLKEERWQRDRDLLVKYCKE